MKNSILSLTLFLVCTFSLSAQAQTMSPSETYLAYHKAVVTASKSADYISYSTAEMAAKMRALSAKKQADLLEMVQIFVGSEKDLKIVSETINGKKATVKVTYCSDGKRGTTDVSMIMEGDSWKVGKAHAKTSLKKCS